MKSHHNDRLGEELKKLEEKEDAEFNAKLKVK
jgi:hypothetical protein